MIAEENSSRVDIDMPFIDDGRDDDDALVGIMLFVERIDPSTLPSFNHRIVIGGSPLITEHKILALDPSSKNLGNENGSINGAPIIITINTV